MQQVRGRKPFGDDVAGLHQLERELKRIRVVQAAADAHRVLHEAIALGASANLVFQLKRGRGPIGNAPQIL